MGIFVFVKGWLWDLCWFVALPWEYHRESYGNQGETLFLQQNCWYFIGGILENHRECERTLRNQLNLCISIVFV